MGVIRDYKSHFNHNFIWVAVVTPIHAKCTPQGHPLKTLLVKTRIACTTNHTTARRLVSLSKVYAQWESMDLDFHKELNYTGCLSRLV